MQEGSESRKNFIHSQHPEISAVSQIFQTLSSLSTSSFIYAPSPLDEPEMRWERNILRPFISLPKSNLAGEEKAGNVCMALTAPHFKLWTAQVKNYPPLLHDNGNPSHPRKATNLPTFSPKFATFLVVDEIEWRKLGRGRTWKWFKGEWRNNIMTWQEPSPSRWKEVQSSDRL